ncbi:hypothetical protein AOR13_2988 [Alteromonas stellipolaris LMG 21856]|nr:hypothetical protein AOR13_2988 [Alteromonas stellipolaris LMG 21856]
MGRGRAGDNGEAACVLASQRAAASDIICLLCATTDETTRIPN